MITKTITKQLCSIFAKIVPVLLISFGILLFTAHKPVQAGNTDCPGPCFSDNDCAAQYSCIGGTCRGASCFQGAICDGMLCIPQPPACNMRIDSSTTMAGYCGGAPTCQFNGTIAGTGGCSRLDGTNPGPWLLAVYNIPNPNVGSGWISRSAFNRGPMQPAISNPPAQGQAYTLACQRVGSIDLGDLTPREICITNYVLSCTNTCPAASPPSAPFLNAPANGAVIPPGTVFDFTWNNFGNWGGCGGNSCSTGCQGGGPGTFTVYVKDPNNVWYNNGGISGNSMQAKIGGTPQNGLVNMADAPGIWSWYVTATSACGMTATSPTYTFTTNRPPTIASNTVSYTNAPTCTNAVNSRNWIGIHPSRVQAGGSSGNNNPFNYQVTYQDLDGVNNLGRMEAWSSASPIAPIANNVSQALYARVGYSSTGGLTLGTYPHAFGTIAQVLPSVDTDPNPGVIGIQNPNRAVCTMSGTLIQSLCDINNIPANAIGYAHPFLVNVYPASNQITINWRFAYLSTVLDTTHLIRFYNNVRDIYNAETGWLTSQHTMNIDLVYPAVTLTRTITAPTAYTISYGVFDSFTVTAQSKSCRAQNNDRAITMTRTSPAGGSLIFPINGTTFNPCFDTNLGAINYMLDNIPKTANITHTMNATDIACNRSPDQSVSVTLKPPWLLTTDGDSYSTNGYQQTSLADILQIVDPLLPKLNGRVPQLSSYSFMQKTATLPARNSQRNYSLINYTDLNDKPRAESGFGDWFSFLKNRTKENYPQAFTQLAQAAYTNVNTSTIGNVAYAGGTGTTFKSRVNVVERVGNLTLTNVTCDTKTIFIISGTLSISPDFNINENKTNPTSGLNMNGCLFIVGGKTTILPGTDKPPVNPANVPYDLVKAFFITGNFTSQADTTGSDGLLLTGGLITGSNNEFFRDNGVVLNQFAPSEVFEYDGGRYIKLFGDILNYPPDFTIQEKPFIESLGQ